MIQFAKEKKLTQTQVLAKELLKRSLTGKQIENELGIMNYKGRIFDIRDATYLSDAFDKMIGTPMDILKTKMIEKKTRWGVSKIAVYKIAKQYRKEYKRFVKEFCK